MFMLISRTLLFSYKIELIHFLPILFFIAMLQIELPVLKLTHFSPVFHFHTP